MRREAVILMRKLTLSLVVVLINGRSPLALLSQVPRTVRVLVFWVLF
jgi:hypothetical protein